jgi:endonuclease YncB( thermonuclease family)
MDKSQPLDSSVKTFFRLCILSIIFSTPYRVSDPIIGRATVVDGDTIRIHETRIRLGGIDAPEKSQLCGGSDGKAYRCGQQAGESLRDLIGVSSVTCLPVDEDRYRRVVAICYTDGKDLNRWMVQQGFAYAYRRYSRGYEPDEDLARNSRTGFWAGTFRNPADYRRDHKSGLETEAVEGECLTGPKGGRYRMVNGRKRYGC